MDIIKRNFMKLLCSGALKEYDPIEPMSNYKWDKLIKMGLSQSVMPQINAGVKNNPYVPESMPPSVVCVQFAVWNSMMRISLSQRCNF